MKRKSKKSLTKRIKVTKNGKILRRTQNMRHRRSHKTAAQVRRMKVVKTLHGRIARRVKKIVGA